jgi:hypothetical protein
VSHREGPRDAGSPVVADDERALLTAITDERRDVVDEALHAVRAHVLGFVGQVVAALVGHDDTKSRGDERADLLPPRVPELGEAMQEHDERPVPGLDVVELHAGLDLGVGVGEGALVEGEGGVAHRLETVGRPEGAVKVLRFPGI